MALSFNELQTRGLLKLNLTATTGNAALSNVRIFKISITPAAAVTTLVVANAATVTGSDLIHLQAAANGASVILDLGQSGIVFANVSYTLAGSGGLGEIYYLES